MSLGKIVVIGGELSSSTFVRWYRVFDQKREILMISETKYPGFYRMSLPLIVSGIIEAKDALAYTTSYLSLFCDLNYVSSISNIKISDNKVETGEGKEFRYAKLLLSCGTCPSVQGFFLGKVEDAIKLRDVVNEKRTIRVYGGLLGLWAGEVFSSRGYKAEVFVEPGYNREYFDDDLWNLALKKADHKFRITTKKGCDKSLEVVYGYERAKLPKLRVNLPLNEGVLVDSAMRASKNVYAVGPVSRPRDEIMGCSFTPLSDEIAESQGIIAALSVFGRDTKGVIPCLSFRLGKIYLFSAGYTKHKAESLGIKVVNTRMTIPLKDSNSDINKVVIKAIGDRERGKLVGVQIMGPYDALLLGHYAYSLILLGGTLDSLISIPSSYMYEKFFNMNPVIKSVYAIWRKSLEF